MVSNIIRMWLTQKYLSLGKIPLFLVSDPYNLHIGASQASQTQHVKKHTLPLPNLLPLSITFLMTWHHYPLSYSTCGRNLKVILDICLLHPSHPISRKVLKISQICHL